MSNQKIYIVGFVIAWVFFLPKNMLIPNSTFCGWFTNFLNILLIFLGKDAINCQFIGKYKKVNIVLLLFCFVSVISIIYNSNSIGQYTTIVDGGTFDGVVVDGVRNPKNVIYNSICLMITALFVEQLSIKGMCQTLIKTIFYILLIWVIIVDIDAMQHVVVNNSIEGYLVGNKFHVCYLNFYVITLYHMLYPQLHGNSKYIYIVMLAVLMVVSVHTECSTMIVGCGVALLFVFLLPEKTKYYLYSPMIFVIAIFVCDIAFFFFSTWFLQFEIVQDFIIEVLHEDLTLTGRLGMYERILEAFSESPWIGYGYGNQVVISQFFLGASNTQNGIVDLFIQIGIIGCFTFVYLIYQLIKQSQYNMQVYPIIVFLYVFLAVSMVEVPFDYIFILFIILLLYNKSNIERQVI